MSNPAANAILKQTVEAAVREANKDQTHALMQQNHEIQAEILQLRAQLTSISENLKSTTKSVNRAPKATETTTAADGTPVPTKVDTTANVLVSKPAYFKHMYKTSEEFRKEYTNQFIADAIKADTSIAKKKNDADRMAAEATAVWNAVRANAVDSNPEIKAMFAKYNALFDDAKKNHAAAQKAAPLTADEAAPTTQ